MNKFLVTYYNAVNRTYDAVATVCVANTPPHS